MSTAVSTHSSQASPSSSGAEAQDIEKKPEGEGAKSQSERESERESSASAKPRRLSRKDKQKAQLAAGVGVCIDLTCVHQSGGLTLTEWHPASVLRGCDHDRDDNTNKQMQPAVPRPAKPARGVCANCNQFWRAQCERDRLGKPLGDSFKSVFTWNSSLPKPSLRDRCFTAEEVTAIKAVRLANRRSAKAGVSARRALTDLCSDPNPGNSASASAEADPTANALVSAANALRGVGQHLSAVQRTAVVDMVAAIQQTRASVPMYDTTPHEQAVRGSTRCRSRDRDCYWSCRSLNWKAARENQVKGIVVDAVHFGRYKAHTKSVECKSKPFADTKELVLLLESGHAKNATVTVDELHVVVRVDTYSDYHQYHGWQTEAGFDSIDDGRRWFESMPYLKSPTGKQLVVTHLAPLLLNPPIAVQLTARNGPLFYISETNAGAIIDLLGCGRPRRRRRSSGSESATTNKRGTAGNGKGKGKGNGKSSKSNKRARSAAADTEEDEEAVAADHDCETGTEDGRAKKRRKINATAATAESADAHAH